jgi:maleylpyruvate isomerase
MKLYNAWRSSSSYRVRIALHHKQLAFDYLAIDLVAGEQHQQAYRSVNPTGTVPCLVVEEAGKPLLLSQSMAIVEYLEERYPERPLLPVGSAARAQVRMLAELINSGIQPLQNTSIRKKVKELQADPDAWTVHFISQGLQGLEQLAQHSAGSFLVGEAVSLADCFLVPQLYAARRFNVDVSVYPTLTRIEQNCLGLPAFEKAHPDSQPDARPV